MSNDDHEYEQKRQRFDQWVERERKEAAERRQSDDKHLSEDEFVQQERQRFDQWVEQLQQARPWLKQLEQTRSWFAQLEPWNQVLVSAQAHLGAIEDVKARLGWTGDSFVMTWEQQRAHLAQVRDQADERSEWGAFFLDAVLAVAPNAQHEMAPRIALERLAEVVNSYPERVVDMMTVDATDAALREARRAGVPVLPDGWAPEWDDPAYGSFAEGATDGAE